MDEVLNSLQNRNQEVDDECEIDVEVIDGHGNIIIEKKRVNKAEEEKSKN